MADNHDLDKRVLHLEHLSMLYGINGKLTDAELNAIAKRLDALEAQLHARRIKDEAIENEVKDIRALIAAQKEQGK